MAIFQKETEYLELFKWCLTLMIAILYTATLRTMKKTTGWSLSFGLIFHLQLVAGSFATPRIFHPHEMTPLWIMFTLTVWGAVYTIFIASIMFSNRLESPSYYLIVSSLFFCSYVRLVYIALTDPPKTTEDTIFLFLNDSCHETIDEAIRTLITN